MAISVASAYFKGLGLALKHPFMVFLKWILNLAFAALLIRPLFRLLTVDLDHSQVGRDLWTGLDLNYLLETFYRSRPALPGHLLLALLGGFLFLWLNLYLTGGILHGLQQKRGLSAKRFGQACSDRLKPMFSNLICCAVLLSAAVLVPFVAWDVFLENQYAAFPKSLLQLRIYWAGVVFIALFLFTWVARVHDFSRVLICRNTGSESAYAGLLGGIRAFFKAMGFTTRYFVSSWILWLLFTATQLLLIGLFLYSFQSTADQGPQWFWWELIPGQLLVLARIGCGLGGLAGAALFLNSRLHPRGQAPEPQAQPKAEEGVPATTGGTGAEYKPSETEADPAEKDRDEEPPADLTEIDRDEEQSADLAAMERDEEPPADPDAVYLQKGRETMARLHEASPSAGDQTETTDRPAPTDPEDPTPPR